MPNRSAGLSFKRSADAILSPTNNLLLKLLFLPQSHAFHQRIMIK
nr:MAG TPA: hypothetical protein [Caudoviricetes sp.]